MLLKLFLLLLWGSSSSSVVVSANTQNTSKNSPFRVRVLTKHNNNNNEDENDRTLLDFIPSFSADGVDTNMPLLTLQLEGLSGQMLSDDAYDAIQYAMSDYLTKFLNKRWPETSTADFDAGDVGMTAATEAGGTAAGGGNAKDASVEGPTITPALSKVRTEVIADRPYYASSSGGGGGRQRKLQEALGNEVDIQTTLTFRDLTQLAGSIPDGDGIQYDEAETSSSSSSSNPSLPSESALQGVAGDAWNDLNNFLTNYLYVAIGAQGETVQQEFMNLESVKTVQDFPTSPPTAAPTPPPTSATEDTTDKDTPQEGDADGGDGSDPSIAQVNDSSNLVAQEGMNPLYPALIAGLTVFLCTIIVLGYRRHRSTELIGNKEESLEVRNTFTQDGDEELEVEDPYMKGQYSDRRRSSSSDARRSTWK